MSPKLKPSPGLMSLVVIIVLSSSVLLGLIFLSSQHSIGSNPLSNTENTAASSITYSDEGLKCDFAPRTPNYVLSLVPNITQCATFLEFANGLPYVYVYTDNVTNNVNVIGGTTQYLPSLVELGFYTFGSGTKCGDSGTNHALHIILVQVPIENGIPDLNGANFHISGPGY
jgi:hypothetical protein